MLEMYATGAFSIDPTDPRNQFNERALHEARIATEYREYVVERADRTGLIARIRAAFAGHEAEPAAPVCAACPA